MKRVAILVEILNKKKIHPKVIPTIEPVSKPPLALDRVYPYHLQGGSHPSDKNVFHVIIIV